MRGALAVLVLALGCGDDGASATGESDGGTSSSSAAGDASASETAPDPTSSTDTTSGATTVAAESDTGAATESGDATTGATGSTGTSGDTTGIDASSSTGDGLADVPAFTELAHEAGVEYTQGILAAAPNCLIDQIGPGNGGFCTPERTIGGAAVGDVDGDGWDDLFVTRIGTTDILFHNEGDGTFTDVSAESGFDLAAHSSGAAFADVDDDGDLDLYVSAIASTRYFLWINDGTGHFDEDAIARGAALESVDIHVGMSVAVGDYDLDGYVDLYVGEWRTEAALGEIPSHSRLLHNLGAAAPGHFVDVTNAAGVNVDNVWELVGNQAPGVYSFSPSFADLNDDGWPDLSIAADFDTSRLFWNDGDGTFTDGTIAAGVGIDKNGMGSTFGDYDSDGDLDWYVTSISQENMQPQNRFYRNTGMELFGDLAIPLEVGNSGWGWGAAFFDANNDGDLDLAAANGYYFTDHLEESIRLWSNEGNGPFLDISAAAGMGGPRQRRGVLTFDYDHDGDLDLFVTTNCGSPELYRNDNGNDADWLRVRTIGTATNTEGIGARVFVRAYAGAPTQMREIGSSSHFMGQSERTAHFGLGVGDDPVAEVRVRWPLSGQEQLFVDVARNSELVVEEP